MAVKTRTERPAAGAPVSAARVPVSAAGASGMDGLRAAEGEAPRSDLAPRRDAGPASSWGLGDGQAVPWEYAPAPESRDIVTVQPTYGLFINGRFTPAKSGETFVDINPATEEVLTKVARGREADVELAGRAARTAFRRGR